MDRPHRQRLGVHRTPAAYINEGTYIKTGAGSRVYFAAGRFDNRGSYDVTAGSVSIDLNATADGWHNAGQLTVRQGASMSVSVPRFNENSTNSGTVRIERDASLTFGVTISSNINSTGAWIVEQGGQLHFSGSYGDDDWGGSSAGDSFGGAGIRNDGVVRFSGNYVRNGIMTGSGRLELLNGAIFAGSISGGSLLIDQPRETPFLPLYGGVRLGSAHLRELEWGSAFIEAYAVTVDGPARLYGGTHQEYSDGEGLTFGVREKRIESHYTFNGDVDWAADNAMTGPGTITIGTDGRFLDSHDYHRPYGSTGARLPQYIDIAEFDNRGTYLKTGAGDTVMRGRFVNSGQVAVHRGNLTLAGATDNTGTLEATGGARLVVHGPLQQLQRASGWFPPQQELTGGRYVMRDGVIVLTPPAAATPQLDAAKIVFNNADVVLDGPRAQLRVAHLGNEYEALDHLAVNTGSLSLLNGAGLGVVSMLINEGVLSIGAGSALDVSGSFASTGAAWIGGQLAATDMRFFGTLSAGLEGDVGQASLTGGPVRVGSTNLLHLDVLALDSFDLLALTGAAALDGHLWADFGTEASPLGSYRFLVAEGGVSGRFASIGSNLDPSRYLVSAVYGADYVDLTVAAVPEPQTYALMAVGLAALWGGRRRARAARA